VKPVYGLHGLSVRSAFAWPDLFEPLRIGGPGDVDFTAGASAGAPNGGSVVRFTEPDRDLAYTIAEGDRAVHAAWQGDVPPVDVVSIFANTVLRQLADGVARDVRARREIEAARAESRQSIRILLIIQAGLLVLLAVVPTFAAPYGTPSGQVVMAVVLAGTAALLVWMRRLSLGRPSLRFFGSAGAP